MRCELPVREASRQGSSIPQLDACTQSVALFFCRIGLNDATGRHHGEREYASDEPFIHVPSQRFVPTNRDFSLACAKHFSA